MTIILTKDQLERLLIEASAYPFTMLDKEKTLEVQFFERVEDNEPNLSYVLAKGDSWKTLRSILTHTIRATTTLTMRLSRQTKS